MSGFLLLCREYSHIRSNLYVIQGERRWGAVSVHADVLVNQEYIKSRQQFYVKVCGTVRAVHLDLFVQVDDHRRKIAAVAGILCSLVVQSRSYH